VLITAQRIRIVGGREIAVVGMAGIAKLADVPEVAVDISTPAALRAATRSCLVREDKELSLSELLPVHIIAILLLIALPAKVVVVACLPDALHALVVARLGGWIGSGQNFVNALIVHVQEKEFALVSFFGSDADGLAGGSALADCRPRRAIGSCSMCGVG
jgi:hypothetical protein